MDSLPLKMKKRKGETDPVKLRSVRESWKVIRNCCKRQFPDFDVGFDRGASAKSVRELGKYCGRQLPTEFRRFVEMPHIRKRHSKPKSPRPGHGL